MTLIVVLLQVLSFGLTVLVMRFFFKRLSDKIDFKNTIVTVKPAEATTTDNKTVFPFTTGAMSGTSAYPLPKPVKNEVENDDSNELDFNETSLNAFPTGVKVEVEGGDSNVPPGFEEKEDK